MKLKITSHQIEAKIDSDRTWMTSDKTWSHAEKPRTYMYILRHIEDNTEGHSQKAKDS